MAFIVADDFPAIRAVIDTTIDSDDLTDATILLQVFAGRADEWLYALVPDADSRTGAEAVALRTAVIFKCAALLVKSVPLFTSETLPEYQYQRPRIDVDAKQADLNSQAEAAIDPIVNPTVVAGLRVATHFVLAKASRGA